MYQIEEFTKYIYQQVEGDENQVILEEQREEKNMEDGEDIKNIWDKEYMIEKFEPVEEASNRLNPENKKYMTYSTEYKMKIVQELN